MTPVLQQGIIHFIDFILNLKCWSDTSSEIWFDKQNNTIDKNKTNILANFDDMGVEFIKAKNKQNYELLFFSLNCYAEIFDYGDWLPDEVHSLPIPIAYEFLQEIKQIVIHSNDNEIEKKLKSKFIELKAHLSKESRNE